GEIQFLDRSLVVLSFEGCFPDVVMRLRTGGRLWKLLEQLLEGRGHSFGIIQLPKDERLLLERGLAFFRLRVTGQQLFQVASGELVLFRLLISEGALRKRGGRLWIIAKRVEEISKGIDRLVRLFGLRETPTQFEGGFRTQLFGQV